MRRARRRRPARGWTNPPPRNDAQTALETELARALGPLARPRLDIVRRLRLAWLDICGAVLARHAEPLGMDGSLLLVGVRGGDWREALFEQRRTLLRRVRRYAPHVQGIRLRNLPSDAPQAPPPLPVPVDPDPRTESIADPALRRAFDGLLAASARAREDA